MHWRQRELSRMLKGGQERCRRGIGLFHSAETGPANLGLALNPVFAATSSAYERINPLGPIQGNG